MFYISELGFQTNNYTFSGKQLYFSIVVLFEKYLFLRLLFEGGVEKPVSACVYMRFEHLISHNKPFMQSLLATRILLTVAVVVQRNHHI